LDKSTEANDFLNLPKDEKSTTEGGKLVHTFITTSHGLAVRAYSNASL